MDFRSLMYFCTVADELNFTHAAEKLNMSQPPLSSQIKNLEEDLGVQLFIRGKRKLRLTEAGYLLYHRSRQMLGLAEKTRGELDALEQSLSGTVCLGLVGGKAPFMAAEWIGSFLKLHKGINFHLIEGSGDEIINLLFQGLIDLAVIARPYDTDRIEGIPVGSEPWTAHFPADHPLAKVPGTDVPLSALVNEPLIIPDRAIVVEGIHNWFAGIGAVPHIIAKTASYLSSLALTRAGAGIAVLPQTHKDKPDGIVCKVITEPSATVEYMLVTERGTPMSASSKAFFAFVQEDSSEKV